MKNYCYALFIGLIFGCKTPYQPSLAPVSTNYLVVEGVINSNSADSTFIKLSRSVHLSSSVSVKPEIRALVSVEDGQGFAVALREIFAGNYATGPLGLNPANKYRLRIKTTENKTYLSDLISVLPTPPIDSIGFYNRATGIQIYANTHDPDNKTRYYRWDFTETWKFAPAYKSLFITNGIEIVSRTQEQMLPSYCWGNDISKNIAINSSVKLTKDVIYQAPITYIDGSSEKISLRYSILLKQYALTKEAYTFWEQLKKNTESLGSIFDAQPSESASNIHCADKLTEPVLGYISISNIQSKRVYFNKSEMHIFTIPDAVLNCHLDSMYFIKPVDEYEMVQTNLIPGKDFLPISYFREYGGGYMSTTRGCADCSTRGAIKPPPFWKD